MTTTSGILPPSQTAAAATPTVAEQSRSQYDEDFELFLTLLTTQIQNQNPLDPMNSNEMTQQVVNYSQLEQQINSNEELERINANLAQLTVSNAVSYLGDTVTYVTDKSNLANGEANWRYNIQGGTASTIEITITNEAGDTVRTETINGPLSGFQEYTWDGRADDGTQSPAGAYTISVNAQDNDGKVLSVATAGSGVVTEVDLAGDAPILTVNGDFVSLDDIISIARQSN